MIYAGTYYQGATEADDATEPVSLEEAKSWSKIDYADLDDEITDMIKSARQDVELVTGLKLVDSTVVVRFNAKCDEDMLIMFPFAAVGPDAVVVKQLVKGEEPETMVADEDYYFDDQLSFVSPGKYQLEYSIDASKVPETLKEAIMMLVDFRMKHKGDDEQQQGFPKDVMSKIERFVQPVI